MTNLRNLRSLRENFVESFPADYADILRAVNGVGNDKGDVVKFGRSDSGWFLGYSVELRIFVL